MLYNELPVSFPWYEKIEMQNRYNENVEPICDYRLISPRNALLPFQFCKPYDPDAPATVVDFDVREINSNNQAAELSANVSYINRAVKDNKEYYTYYGVAIPGLNLTRGFYYATILLSTGQRFYSEMFFIPQDSFLVEGLNSLLILKWSNTSDIRPIFYNDLVLGKPKFVNVLYLDTFIHASEPEYFEDVENDANDEPVATFQKLTTKYLISFPCPDFLKRALALLPLHDFVEVTTSKGVRRGEIKNVLVESEIDAGGAISTVNIKFSQDFAVTKKGCADNME